MNVDQIIEAIRALKDVVEVNRGWLGSESTAETANRKIKQLIALLPAERVDEVKPA